MGSRALDELRAEQRTMRKFLDLLQQQVELIAEDRQPDGELLLEIAEYFRAFPDLLHHPKEESILRRVVCRNPAAADELAALEATHEKGSRELARFSRAVVRLLLEPGTSREPFLEVALRFLEHERRHLVWEDRRFFALVEQSLTAEDWAEIDAALGCFTFPVFERDAPARFRRIEHAAGTWRNRTAA
jgi:hemerythrin-like domain-containing protein